MFLFLGDTEVNVFSKQRCEQMRLLFASPVNMLTSHIGPMHDCRKKLAWSYHSDTVYRPLLCNHKNVVSEKLQVNYPILKHTVAVEGIDEKKVP